MNQRLLVWAFALLLCIMFWMIILYPFFVHADPAPIPVTGDGSAAVSDAAYGSGWNGDTTNAPSKNAVYDKIETISGGGGSVTIGTTVPLTGAGTGTNFTLGLTPSLLLLQDLGGAVTDAQVPNNITITGLSGTNTGDQDISGKQNIVSLETDVEALVDLQDLQGAATDAQIPNSITVDLAATATALASDPNDCAANQFATTIAANGNLTCAQPSFSNMSDSITDAQVPNNITIDLATTASALANNPAGCTSGDFVNDIAADGTLSCGTPPGGGGGVGIGTVNPGTVGAMTKYVQSTTVDDSAVMFESGGNIGIGTTTPANFLDLQSTLTTVRVVSTTTGGAASGGAFTVAAKTAAAMTLDQRMGAFFFAGSTSAANGLQSAASLEGYAEGTWSAGSSTPSRFAFFTTPSGSTTRTERMRIDSSGNIGVGTYAPNGRMTVFGSSTGAVPIQTWKDSGNTQRMVVMGNGTVGIGTSAPSNTLDVVGTVNATTLIGANVTSGSNPGHTHTTTSVSGIDVSDDTNLAGTTDEIVLTGDTLSLDSKIKGWRDGGTTIYNSTSTDAVGIGTTAALSGFILDVRGSQYVSGNVGIGTTSVPNVPLYVAGTGVIKASEIQGTGAAGTPLTITGGNIGIGTSAVGAAVVVGNSPSHTSTGLCIGTGGCVGYCSGGLAAVCGTCTCLTVQ